MAGSHAVAPAHGCWQQHHAHTTPSASPCAPGRGGELVRQHRLEGGHGGRQVALAARLAGVANTAAQCPHCQDDGVRWHCCRLELQVWHDDQVEAVALRRREWSKVGGEERWKEGLAALLHAQATAQTLTSTCLPKPVASASCCIAATSARSESSTARFSGGSSNQSIASAGAAPSDFTRLTQCTCTSPAGRGASPSGPSCTGGWGSQRGLGSRAVSCRPGRGDRLPVDARQPSGAPG